MLISASAMGYYGDCGEELIPESKPSGDDYLAKLCDAWESAARRVETEGKLSIMRIGLYLHPEDGVLNIFNRLNRFFILSRLGSGKQWQGITSPSLLNDFVLKSIEGSIPASTYNLTGKNSVQLATLVKAISKVNKRPNIAPPVPSFFIRLILGEAATALLSSYNVSGEKLAEYIHQPELETILKNLKM